MKAILIGAGAITVLSLLPVWRYPNECRGLCALESLWREFVLKKRTKHIPVAEAIANARRRYEMGISPSRCRS